jgi:DNA repair exonuclease SbcCD nuclease subunit
MFVFLHTADWQIGKPFGSFPADKAALLREARLEAIDRLAAVARQNNATHVLVAGDVFDGELIADGEIAKALIKMSRAEGLAWHLISGNHDPARPGGIWERVIRSGLPANVVLHLRAGPAEVAPGVSLLAAPLAARRTSIDPTGWMDAAATPEGALRIGLAHGSVEGFGSDGEAEVPISPSRAASARLDYLALGDWHGVTRITQNTWYSGTPEPDRYPDNEPGEALVIRLAGSAAPADVTRVSTRHYRWFKYDMAVADSGGILKLVASLHNGEPGLERVLLKLKLSGHVPRREFQLINEALASLEPLLQHSDVDLSELIPQHGEEELAGLLDGALGRVAAALRARADQSDGEQARSAERALGHLYRYAARHAGAGSQ